MATLEMASKISEISYPIRVRKLLLIIAPFVVFNIVTLPILTQKYPEPMLGATLMTMLVVLPFVCLVVGLFIAIVPFRKLRYKVKYWTSVLILYFIVNIVVTIGLLIGIARFVISGELLTPGTGLFGPMQST